MNKLERSGKSVVDHLVNHGFEAYFVGGCVRDKLLNISPKDIDIVSNASPTDLKRIFDHVIPIGESFGVMLVLKDGFEFEVATARTESSYTDGRRPDKVVFTSFKDDVLRRDLTINGLLYNPLTDEIIDFTGKGIDDINKGLIRFIGDADCRINEDKLRMLRAVRFAAKYGFTMTKAEFGVIKKNAHKINQISAERIKAELDKILLSDKPSVGFNLLKESNLLKEILPELEATSTIPQDKKWHAEGNVFEHTMLLIDNLRKKTDDLQILWGGLLHDIGKVSVFATIEGKIIAHGHDKEGEILAESICKRLRFSNKESNMIVSLVRDHMRIKEASKMKLSKKRKLIAQDNFDKLLLLSITDSESSISTVEFDKFGFVETLQQVVNEPKLANLPKPLITGHSLIELGMKPNKDFKQILEEVYELQLQETVTTKEEAINYIKRRDL